jgi:threonine-phosphate decarboxylase
MTAAGLHGGDGAALARRLGIAPDAVLDLSLSINPCAPDVSELIARHANAVRSYPDDRKATAALADALDVEADRVVLTNGGAEAIALVAALSPVGAVDEPEFSLYRRHLARVEPGAPRWRSNPNNPTGRLAARDDVAAVWDEAFYPLATGRWTRGNDATVVGSLTKVFACPGLRIGYVCATDREAANHIRARRPEWSVNALACEVLPELLATADLPRWAAAITGLREQLVALLTRAGYEPDPSDANYLLMRNAPGLRDRLAARAVSVRDTTSFGIPGGVRIAVPDERGLDRLATALEGEEQ